MDKFFVYRKLNANNQYWSVHHGGWVKYEWATVCSANEVDAIDPFCDESIGEWVRHDPPKPVPVIIGDNSACTMPGMYWMSYVHCGERYTSVQELNEQSIFWKGVSYVYIPEPNWPT